VKTIKKKIAKHTKEDIIELAILKHGRKYDYSKFINYVNNRQKIIIDCLLHGLFEQTIKNHLRGKGCPKCGIEKCKQSRKKIKNVFDHQKNQEIIRIFEQIHFGTYDYSYVKYINSYTKIDVLCKIHGMFQIRPTSHLQGHGCQKCANVYRKKALKDNHSKKPISINDFKNRGNVIHNYKFNYDKVFFDKTSDYITIICPKHGDFIQQVRNHLSGHGCPYCGKSCISKISQTWLDHIGVSNIVGQTREVWIEISPDKKFRADGFDPSTNTVYEFHGDFWHGNLNIYPADFINPVNKKTMGELLKKTQERSTLIRDAGYNLVSIWESDWKNIEKELKENE
jgi:predicted RNA-binding Zn-ribbon protein involved in translation (DUF1610 family)